MRTRGVLSGRRWWCTCGVGANGPAEGDGNDGGPGGDGAGEGRDGGVGVGDGNDGGAGIGIGTGGTGVSMGVLLEVAHPESSKKDPIEMTDQWKQNRLSILGIVIGWRINPVPP